MVIVQIIYVRYDMNVKTILKMPLKYLIAAVIMYIACYIAGRYIEAGNTISIIIKTGVGIITYLGMLMLLKDSYLKSLKTDVKNMLLRN